MPRDLAVIHARASLGRRLLSPADLDREIMRAQRELADDAEIIFASFALHRTGRMARNIHTVQSGKELTVETEARDPQTGFDYVRITRFGHRTFRIVPKRQFAASVIATGQRRAKGHRAMLRWVQTDGGVVYRHSSRGFHPVRDWASEAIPEIRIRAQSRMGALARRIEVSWRGA